MQIMGMSHENSIFTIDKGVREAAGALSIDLDTTSIELPHPGFGWL